MLGWEFPPAFTGGLGVACYNIVKALSTRANVHLIVPYASERNDIDNLEITGLNRAELEFTDEKTAREFQPFFMSRVSVKLSAYPAFETATKFFTRRETDESAATMISSWSDVSSYFERPTLYGEDILQRIQLFAITVRELTASRKFDIIHAHDWPTFHAAIQLKHDSHKPLVLHVHSLETDRSGEKTRNEIYAIERAAMEEADRVIAVSEYTKKEIIAHYAIDERKIEVARNGAEATVPSRFRKKAGEKWVTFVGRITFQKGPQFLVETAKKLIRVYPNVRFIIAGNGDLFPSLVHEVARQRLGRHFSFTGFRSREKIKDLLATSDAYFMPSVSEPFGLSAVEAVQQGTASVISKRSGAAEVLTNALRADFWDTDRFANYLYGILRYPKLKRAIESRSRQDIEHLNWSNTTDKIMNVYEALTP
jgi:glycosyltransferase involved in cell wall biosynthesis